MPDPAPEPPVRSAIERMLRPRSIAIVGASPSPGSLGAGLLANLRRFDFRGDIHLVNAGRSEIDGRACLSSTLALPAGVDCAALAIPGAGVLDAVAGCARQGVGGVIIMQPGSRRPDLKVARCRPSLRASPATTAWRSRAPTAWGISTMWTGFR